jgi:hypothetical protein
MLGLTDLSAPRTDCPLTLPAVPLAATHAIATQRAKPLNDHLEQQLLFYCVNHYPEEHKNGALICCADVATFSFI